MSSAINHTHLRCRMNRIFAVTISMFGFLIAYTQQRNQNTYALVEKAITSKTDDDICNAYCHIAQGRDICNREVTIRGLSDSLQDDEIIIDFFDTPDSDGNSIYYAFVIKKGDFAPELYTICKESELESLTDDGKNFYNNPDVLNLILGPMMYKLKGVGRIYYIPTGEFHKMALEYCKDSNFKMLCENYEVYRLTSSSMICNTRHRKEYQNYSVWGGVDIQLQDHDFQRDTDLSPYDTRQLPYLEDSLTAAEEIVKLLNEHTVTNVAFHHDDTATENNFKAMSGKGIDAFLIETHGIFTRECRVSPKSSNAPLDNHAIALSGSASVMDAGIVPVGYEDGLLTEKEIASLDLSSMDLAVVSACKSGLGDIEWYGVDGLMRGFKQAGVNSLVMTLDDVVDYISGQLWIQLFNNLVSGQSKREALLNGINHIRSMHDGILSHPRYWTPFILIDGIE